MNIREQYMQRISDMLNDAADHIEKHGWHQGIYGGGKRRCVLGAIRTVNPVHHQSGWNFAEICLNAWYPLKGRTRKLYSWNDQRSRKEQEVLDFLRACAKEALM